MNSSCPSVHKYKDYGRRWEVGAPLLFSEDERDRTLCRIAILQETTGRCQTQTFLPFSCSLSLANAVVPHPYRNFVVPAVVGAAGDGPPAF